MSAAPPLASVQGAPRDIAVLVVDDIEENLLAMRALLTRPGVRVLTADCGTAALELLLAEEVALAILDVQMPGMDGFALAELMRGAERTRGVPIIFLTAMPSDGTRSFRGYEAGAVDFLYKPIDPRIIESKVDVFVELFEQRRQLAERAAELQRALQLNETFVAVLTHDLRSPLSAVRAGAEVALAGAADERTRKAAQHIRRSGQRMARMIEQLLDFSHLRSGALRIVPREADLQAACAAAVDEARAARPEAHIALAAHGDLRGSFDADRLTQVFTNLLGNALEHGGGAVEVTLDGRAAGALRVEVANPGELPAAVQAELFVPFRGQRDRASPGLGLGLYIVDQFVRAHGGEVSGRSEAGRTVFRVSIPRRAAPAFAPPRG